MRLRPLRFLWKQFNGPQITAIMTALYRWFQDNFSNTIDYLSTLSIDTATDGHLTLLGACQGVRRPVVIFKDVSNFIFTYEPEHGKDYGVSDLNNPTVGGRFTDLEEDKRNSTAYLCPPTFYRAILQAKRDTSGRGDCIEFLDKMLSNCWYALGNREVPEFEIHYFTSDDVSLQRTYGDIQVILGPMAKWGTTEYAVQWQSVLTAVFNALMNPNSYITFDFRSD